MSHWQKGKLSLNCSLEVLQQALVNVMPTWEKYIQTDTNGSLPLHNSYTNETKKGFHLVIPGGQNPMGGKKGVVSTPGVNYADVGFKKVGDHWEVEADKDGLRINLEGEITAEVAMMKARVIAAMGSVSIISDEKTNGKRRIVLRKKVDPSYHA